MSDVTYGTPVVPGNGYAPVRWVNRPEPLPPMSATVPDDAREAEIQRFHAAATTVSDRLMDRSFNTVGTPSDILMVASTLALDPGLDTKVCTLIRERGLSAPYAVEEAAHDYVAQIKLQGGLLAERTTDILDVKDRINAELLGQPEPGIPTLDAPTVLFADDLAPADTAGLSADQVKAIVTIGGGPTSHTSIIARQMGIPCIVAARDLRRVEEATWVLVDGRTGRIDISPDEDAARHAVTIDEARRAKARSWSGPATTRDGQRVQLLANVQDAKSARAARDAHAEGIGLLRTELCFLNSQTEPTIESQQTLYRSVFDEFPESKVVVRTLDAGSDKPVAWVSTLDEDNPALGVRGIRTSGPYPTILDHQLDAIAAAARGREEHTWVMAPMVSTIAEARWFAGLVRERGMKAGIMVEVPAVAVKAERFLKEVDFVSIGTNDLTQYVMAADRLNSHLATYTDAWQPAVLELIAATARAGRAANKPVGVCGEAAADPLLACVLVGFGVTSLSMASAAIGTVGVQLESVNYEECVAAAQAVLDACDCAEARDKAAAILQR